MSNKSEPPLDLTEENARLKNENRLLRQGLSRLQQSLRALFRLQAGINQINSKTDPVSVIDSILASALEVVNAQNGCLILLDKETNELVYIYTLGAAQKNLSGYRLPPNEGLASWVVNTQKPKLVLDLQKESRFSPLVDQLGSSAITSLICVPLVDQQRSLGAIEVANTSPGQPFREEHLDLLLLVSRFASLMIVRAESNGSS